MKWYALLAAIAAVEAAPAVEKRQLELGFGLISSLATAARKTPLNPATTTPLKSNLFPGATRQRITWGPFTLQPANVNALTLFR
jgi:hypothetical protein